MPPLHPGAELTGRYRLARQLADDGLIETWAATDGVLARAVEVEILCPGADAPERDAFLAAAAATAGLNHPSIVGAYDTGVSADGSPFLVTERAVGPTLAEYLEGHGPLSPTRVVEIGRQIAHALDTAHRRGAVHGAVSPSTVQVTDDGRARLGGFTVGGMRTRLGRVTTGPRDDVDACARTLVAALVGFPVTGDGAVSPRSMRAGVPPALDAALVDALRGGPIDTAGELAERLDRLELADDAVPALDGRPTPPLGTPVTPPPVRADSTRAGAVAGVVVGLLLAVAIVVAAFVLFGQGGPGSSSGPGVPGATSTVPGAHGGELDIVAAHSFDPFGDQTEQEARVDNVRDGNPSTLWSTEEYKTARFGGLKSGVGVILLLDGTHTLNQLTVTSPSRTWMFSVYVAAHSSPTLAGWGQPVVSGVTVTSDITPVDLHGASGAAVLVWITDLGPPLARPPDPATPYRVDIGELQVR